jgi:hypothetical protein
MPASHTPARSAVAEDLLYLPAEEALYLGAAYAHIAAYYEHQRQVRIYRQNAAAARVNAARLARNATPPRVPPALYSRTEDQLAEAIYRIDGPLIPYGMSVGVEL